MLNLDGSARDEKPLVVDTVNWSRLELLVSLDLAGAGFFTVFGMGDADVGAERRLAKSLIDALERGTYSEIPPRPDLPVISLSHASAHSRTTSVAYLLESLSSTRPSPA